MKPIEKIILWDEYLNEIPHGRSTLAVIAAWATVVVLFLFGR